MVIRDDPQDSRDSLILVDHSASTPLLYRPETPALTAESILERSRRRCVPAKPTLRETLWRAANVFTVQSLAACRAMLHQAGHMKRRIRPRQPRAGVIAAAAVLAVLVAAALALTRADRVSTAAPVRSTSADAAIPAAASGRMANGNAAIVSEPPHGTEAPAPAGTAGTRETIASAIALDVSGTDRAVPARISGAQPLHPPHPASPPSRLVGTLLVDSDPSGAEVSINGVSHGRTPLSVSALPVGSRVVRVELAGYEPWSWSVRIVANKRTPVQVKLQPERRRAIPGF